MVTKFVNDCAIGVSARTDSTAARMASRSGLEAGTVVVDGDWFITMLPTMALPKQVQMVRRHASLNFPKRKFPCTYRTYMALGTRGVGAWRFTMFHA